MGEGYPKVGTLTSKVGTPPRPGQDGGDGDTKVGTPQLGQGGVPQGRYPLSKVGTHPCPGQDGEGVPQGMYPPR